MFLPKVCILFVLFLNIECGVNFARQSVGSFRKESTLKTWKRGRGEAFENVFIVYDPSFLSLVWPKISNGMHLLLEMSCWDDMSVFLKDLAEGRAWAYDAVDASGRYQSGLFTGSRFWLGSKDECLRLDNNFMKHVDNETLTLLRNNDYIDSVLRKQKYFDAEANDWRWVIQHDELTERLVVADHRPPYRMAYTTLQIQLNVTKITMAKSYDVTLGLCLPKSCPSDDIESIINFSIMLNDNLKTNKSTPRIARITSSRQITGHFDIGTDAGAISLITVTVLIVTMAIIATLAEFDLLKCVRYKSKSMSFDLPKYNNSENKLVDELRRKHNGVRSLEDISAESANLNPVPMSKGSRSIEAPPHITLGVVNVDRMSGSCNRCGKYKRQCVASRQVDNLPACPRVKYSSFASLSTEDRRKKTFFCNLLLCFSLHYCWKRIFNKDTANKDLSLIHVMRIVATLWIIFIHVAVIAGYISDDAGDINERDNVYYILATGTIAFDTLFFVSGMFSSHHFFYLKSRYSVEELVSFDGACGQFMQFVCFVTNRVIRLLPSYAYTVTLSSVIARASRSTSALVLPDADHENCDHFWWRNLLYITTMYPNNEQCMQVSWYLSTETQLHVLGALVCAASMSAGARARAAAAAAATGALAATGADVVSLLDAGARYSNVYEVYSTVIERPWARVAPYFVGMFAGWLIHTMRGRLKLTKLISSFLWSATIPLLVVTWSLPWVSQPWLSAWIHLAWPFALLWPVLACTTCYAGLFRGTLGSVGAALSRLSYSMLLLHGAAARLLLLASDTALCSHTLCIWMYFAGTTAVTLLAALLLTLLIEMPCCSLFRRLSDCATT